MDPSGSGLGSYVTEDPLETRIANISMDFAAAIAHTQAEARERQRVRRQSDGALENEMGATGAARSRRQRGREEFEGEGGEEDAVGEVDDDNDDDEGEEDDGFPQPLRAQKGKDSEGTVGVKRKRR